MIRTQISFDSDLYERAKRLARRQGVSLAELCRRGLRAMLARDSQHKDWMKYAGSVCSGDERASETVDEVVYGRQEP